jgi:hypothetical protein
VTARHICAILALAIAAIAGATALPAAAAGGIEGQCNSKAGSYLFWPHGHPAIPGIGFPAFPTPHLELYGGLHRTSFPDKAEDAYIDSTGAAGVAKRCRKSGAGFINAHVNHAKSTRSTHEIECNFKHLVSYRLAKTAGGARLQTVLSGGAVVVDVKMGSSGSSITWDKRYCKALSPPS